MFVIKRGLLFGTGIVVGTIAPIVVFAQSINAFTSHIEINKDGTLSVQEEIVYHFGETERHGIFRRIPLIYRVSGDEEDTKINISNVLVTDKDGTMIPVEFEEGGNSAEIKIGDPEVVVSGQHLYVLRYRVRGAVRTRGEHDELHWNVNSANWPIPIERIRGEVVLPAPVLKEEMLAGCIAGAFGKIRECGFATSTRESTTGNISMIRFEDGNLLPNEGMTIVVGFPKGIIQYERQRFNVNLDLSALILFVALSLSFIVWRKYKNHPHLERFLTEK